MIEATERIRGETGPRCERCGGKLNVMDLKGTRALCEICRDEISEEKDKSAEFLNSIAKCTRCGYRGKMRDFYVDNRGLLCEICATGKRVADQARELEKKVDDRTRG